MESSTHNSAERLVQAMEENKVENELNNGSEVSRRITGKPVIGIFCGTCKDEIYNPAIHQWMCHTDGAIRAVCPNCMAKLPSGTRLHPIVISFSASSTHTSTHAYTGHTEEEACIDLRKERADRTYTPVKIVKK